MTEIIKLDTDDVKKIIAEHFHIDEKKIIKTQYSFLIPKSALRNESVTA